MTKDFHIDTRSVMTASLKNASIAILFSGKAPRKTRDEYYPYFANRNFVYMTGISQQESVYMSHTFDGEKREGLFILPKDLMAERWVGRRLTANEANELSGIENIGVVSEFNSRLDSLITSGKVENIYLDFDKYTREEPDDGAYMLAAYIKERFPFVRILNLQPQLKTQRTIKKACEIEAMRYAETITRDGILAMMKASKPGMYEYEYRAEYDYALTKRGVVSPGFPPTISAGANNFCIHYYSTNGQAQDGDMILNDVGACWDNEINDVSRGWPCNGKFTEKQRLLYECAYNTSNESFATLKPGIPMADVDLNIRKYCFEQLKGVGLVDKYDEVGKYMWHGGAHHVGFDVHDLVDMSRPLEPGMVFCVDVGIYCEEWGIGFRLEDNCLITDKGCENLSAVTPRSIADIEAVMGKA